jgi:hypothetical protein
MENNDNCHIYVQSLGMSPILLIKGFHQVANSTSKRHTGKRQDSVVMLLYSTLMQN